MPTVSHTYALERKKWIKIQWPKRGRISLSKGLANPDSQTSKVALVTWSTLVAQNHVVVMLVE
jgi:hypothetical protein